MKLVKITAVVNGVKLMVQLDNGARLAQLLLFTVTFPAKAVPVNCGVILVAVTVDEVLLMVKVPAEPLVYRVRGEPVTVNDAVGAIVILALAVVVFVP